jgi:peptide/nickel transport system substrate-binding protein
MPAKTFNGGNVKARNILAVPLLAGALALAACGGAKNQEPPGAAQASDTATVASATSQDINVKDRADLTQGGTVRLDVADFGGTWNTGNVNINNDDILKSELPTLPLWFNIDAKGVATPNPDYLLSATEVSKSPTVVNYKLNPKAVWGDGSPIDADDMIATWKAFNGENKKFQVATTQGYDAIKDIKAGADKFDVTVTYKTAYPDWTSTFGGEPSVNKAESVKDPDTFNNGWTDLKNEWLSGPFKVQSFNKSEKVLTLVPNDKWWGAKPLLDKITFRAISPDAVAAAFVNNELDAFDIGPDPDAFKRASGVSDAAIRKAAGPNFRHITFNTKAGVLTDVAVRRAIVEGLDRTAIGESDLAGLDWAVVPLNNHILLTNQNGYADSAQATGIEFNVDKAKSDLDAAGWKAGADGIREKDGKKLEVKFSQLSGVPVSENEALQVQNQLKDIGIKVNIVNVPVAKFQDGTLLTKHEFELVAFTWVGTPYPFTSIKQIYGTGQESNFAQLSMPEVDALIKQIDVETDPAKRIDLANQADKIIWENVHTLPLYQRPELIAVKSKLANYGAFGFSDKTFHWEDVGYEK